MIAKDFGNRYGLSTDEKGLKAFEEAKAIMKRDYASCEREWLESSPADSYSSDRYRVTIAVLAGSPPKAMVLYDKGHGIVRGFDNQGDNVLVFRFPRQI